MFCTILKWVTELCYSNLRSTVFPVALSAAFHSSNAFDISQDYRLAMHLLLGTDSGAKHEDMSGVKSRLSLVLYSQVQLRVICALSP